MRVEIDVDVCVGTGQCELICPEVFTVGVVAEVTGPVPPASLEDAVREAAGACPTQAILITG